MIRTIAGRLALALVLVCVVLGAMVGAGIIPWPNRLNPFTPLQIGEEPNWLTRFKLARLERDAPQCLLVLRNSPVVHAPSPDRTSERGCSITDAVEVSRSSVTFNRPFPATCSLAVGWALFETHVLQPAARRHFGRHVVGVAHLGTYSCRNIDHRSSGRRSEHARANAIDLAGFILEDGSRISVAADWASGDPRRTGFLRDVRDGACELFEVVLGPDYNAAHRDHFHFDMGSYRACR